MSDANGCNRRPYSFTDHPTSVGENYREHFRSAFGFGRDMLRAGAACLIHGIFPFLFVTTGSRTIARLHDRMIVNRVRQQYHGDNP
ncbi:MAG TPA: DUF6356 family protein [Candidatus Binataceae bacterium]|nr:DUF6356 family protein [Candidatus Binataceae bacterium]